MEKYLLAVYGTLKADGSNHSLIEGAQFLGEGLTPPNYDLLDFGGFPGAVSGDLPIKVEVWEIDEAQLVRVDRLEGHPNYYMRSRVNIKLPTGTVKAWMYTLRNQNTYERPIIRPKDGILSWTQRENRRYYYSVT